MVINPSLRQRVLRSGLWSFGAFGVSQIIKFSSNLILSHLLAPEAFGVLAIATTVMVGFAMIFDVGLKPHVIQSKRGHDELFLNTVWVVQIMHGIVICVGTVLVGFALLGLGKAKLVPSGTVYADPLLAYVVVAISITGLITGVRSTKIYVASRELALGRIAQIELIGQTLAALTMICWAYFAPSIWALVAGFVTATTVTSLLSHAWLPGPSNSWRWDSSAFKEIVHFGKWIVLSSSLGFLVANGDRLILGSLTTPVLLGAYSFAFVIFSTFEQLAVRLITEISLPALSEIARHRSHELRANFYKLHLVISSFTYVCAGILLVSGRALTHFLFDARYHDAGWILQILAWALLATPFNLGAQLYVVAGAPHLYSRIAAVRLITLLIFTFAGFSFGGIEAAIWGIMLSYWAGVPIIMFHMIKYKVFNIGRELLHFGAFGVGIVGGIILDELLTRFL